MHKLIVAAFRCALMFLVPALAYADSAQWDLDPISGDWNTAANWTPMTVPNGPTDTATFDLSNTTNVSISANTEVDAITFTPAASAYTITADPNSTLTISGVGIANNVGTTQNFVTAVDAGNRGQIFFVNSATAGTSTTFTNNGASVNGTLPAGTWFLDTSSSGNGTFINKGGAVSGNPLFQGGFTAFADSSSAGNGSFTNDGGMGGVGGQILFFDTSTAGDGTFFNKSGTTDGAGGYTEFFNGSSAANGTFTNESSGPGFFGYTRFSDTSTAGNGVFVNQGGTVSEVFNGGETAFSDASTAADATITNNGAAASNTGGGQTNFFYNSTAGSATIFNNGGAVSGAYGGRTQFFAYFGNPTAGSAAIINDGGAVSGAYGGLTDFSSFNGTPTAGSAILVANGGSNGGEGGMISFEDNSTGGTSRIEVFGNGSLDISGQDSPPSVTIGSIEGDGDAFLGANNLTVGSNNLSTTFSGAIQDGGFGGSLTKIGTSLLILTAANAYNGVSNINGGVLQVDDSVLSDTFAIQDGGVGGSFTKIGTGMLELAGINTYTGDTNVNGGMLQIDGSIASNTFVNDDGTLAGSGTVNGAVTNNDSGTISPGDALGVPGVLTIGSNYTQVPTATLVIQIGGPDAIQVSVLDVRGSANLNGYLEPVLVNDFVPRIGQSFTIINYASHTGFFSHIQNQVFDHGRKRWLLVYLRTSAVLIAIKNGSRVGVKIDNTGSP